MKQMRSAVEKICILSVCVGFCITVLGLYGCAPSSPAKLDFSPPKNEMDLQLKIDKVSQTEDDKDLMFTVSIRNLGASVVWVEPPAANANVDIQAVDVMTGVPAPSSDKWFTAVKETHNTRLAPGESVSRTISCPASIDKVGKGRFLCRFIYCGPILTAKDMAPKKNGVKESNYRTTLESHLFIVDMNGKGITNVNF